MRQKEMMQLCKYSSFVVEGSLDENISFYEMLQMQLKENSFPALSSNSMQEPLLFPEN